MRFRVDYIGPVGFRTCFWEAESEAALRKRWAEFYPGLKIQSVEVVR